MDQPKNYIRPPSDAYVPSDAFLTNGADPEAIEQQRYVSAFLYPELWKLDPNQNLYNDQIDLLAKGELEFEEMVGGSSQAEEAQK